MKKMQQNANPYAENGGIIQPNIKQCYARQEQTAVTI